MAKAIKITDPDKVRITIDPSGPLAGKSATEVADMVRELIANAGPLPTGDWCGTRAVITDAVRG